MKVADHCIGQLPCIACGCMFTVSITQGFKTSKKLVLSTGAVTFQDDDVQDPNVVVPFWFDYGSSKAVMRRTMDSCERTGADLVILATLLSSSRSTGIPAPFSFACCDSLPHVLHASFVK